MHSTIYERILYFVLISTYPNKNKNKVSLSEVDA